MVPGCLDFPLCIICQEGRKDDLVEKPSSHEKLLNTIEHAKYGDVKLTELWSVLKDLPIEDLTEKVTWHRKCYQDTTHLGMLKRARERFEREAAGSNKSRRKSSDNVQAEQRFFTRSQTAPFDQAACFFCDSQTGDQQPLHKVSTISAGSSIDAAVKNLGDPKLLAKLSTTLNSQEAHAIDIRYHKNCCDGSPSKASHNRRTRRTCKSEFLSDRNCSK